MEDFQYTIGAELEFYVLDEQGSLIADLESGDYPKKQFNFLPQHIEFIEKLTAEFISAQLEKEDGAGQLEVHFGPFDNYQELAHIADKFKAEAQEFASKNGYQLSFEGKPFENMPGSALHIHLSSELFDPYGIVENGGFMSPKVSENNDYLLWAIGGLLEKLPEDLDIFLPNEKSKKRITAWQNAPTKICWGKNNRSVAIRLPDSKPKRLEHRVSSSDANIAKACEAVINAAKHGIENKTDAGEPIYGNAWDGKYKLPLIV